jgi:hypothetical protein
MHLLIQLIVIVLLLAAVAGIGLLAYDCKKARRKHRATRSVDCEGDVWDQVTDIFFSSDCWNIPHLYTVYRNGKKMVWLADEMCWEVYSADGIRELKYSPLDEQIKQIPGYNLACLREARKFVPPEEMKGIEEAFNYGKDSKQ